MRARLVAPLLALLAAAAPSHAAMRPMLDHVVDPKGDAKGNLGFADVVTGRWSTTGRGDEKLLVGTLTLAGPPRTDAGFGYELSAEAQGCGLVSFRYAPGTVFGLSTGPGSFYADCGNPGDALDSTTVSGVNVVVSGRSITWSVPMVALPKQVRPGTSLSTFLAVADVGEPLSGHSPGEFVFQPVDRGTGHSRWVIR